MKKIITILLLAFIIPIAWSLDIDPYKGPKPIAVLIQTDPWLMVIGSDTPMVAIYEDGQVIYLKKEKDKPSVYLHKQLTKDELDGVKKKIVFFVQPSDIKRSYDLAPNVTDQPETKIYINIDGKIQATTIYGLIKSLPAYSSSGEKRPDQLPSLLTDLNDYLTNLSFPDAKEWEPAFVEAMVWGGDEVWGTKPSNIHWPKEWPGPNSPNSVKRKEIYSIFLPGTELTKLRNLVKEEYSGRGGVLIEGKQWAVDFRFTFPNEPVWIEAFKQNK